MISTLSVATQGLVPGSSTLRVATQGFLGAVIDAVERLAGAAPGRKKRRKLQILEFLDETFVFETREELEEFVSRVVEPLVEARRKAAEPVPQARRYSIRTHKKAAELQATVVPPQWKTLQPEVLLEQQLAAFAAELEQSQAEWRRILDQEDEELLWLL